MDDPNTTTGIQTDEDILTYTASDEALEAAAGIEGDCTSPMRPTEYPYPGCPFDIGADLTLISR
jgi:hypothetical protein